jgi:hypothetical protein
MFASERERKTEAGARAAGSSDPEMEEARRKRRLLLRASHEIKKTWRATLASIHHLPCRRRLLFFFFIRSLARSRGCHVTTHFASTVLGWSVSIYVRYPYSEPISISISISTSIPFHNPQLTPRDAFFPRCRCANIIIIVPFTNSLIHSFIRRASSAPDRIGDDSPPSS